MVKIENLEIKGLRGIKKSSGIPLDESKSILIYGDNGSGKSSITDALEWFYYDRVDHLSSEEIGRKGIDALRNIFLDNDKDAYIDLKFSNSKLDSRKKLFYKHSKLSSEYSNTTNEFNDYIRDTLNENLILRYKDLLKFILFSKKEKLEEISQIIGFTEVTKIKGIFKKTVNSLRKDIKIKNLDGLISNKQAIILEQIGQNVNNDEQYFKAIAELIKPLKLSIEVKDDKSIEEILEFIKRPQDEEVMRLKISYEKTIEKLSGLEKFVGDIIFNYKNYHQKYQKISENINKFKKIKLETLLSEGLSILEKKFFEDEKCPLCLQAKNREELISELRERINELKDVKKEKQGLKESGETTHKIIENIISEVETILLEKCLSIEENSEIKNELERFKKETLDLLNEFKGILGEKREVKTPEEFVCLNITEIQKIIDMLKEKVKKMSIARKDDLKFSINSKLLLVKQAYTEVKSLKKEMAHLKQQLRSMELIYNEFAKKQKDNLASFLTAISKDINDFYLHMNRSEEVDEIELIPLDKDDELVGITIQFKFHGEIVSPPDKYLSESHLNCLGICLFLSSVKTYNTINKFFILDDVISSFDKNHRLRFTNLLIEKFSDYQIFLFTHERDWFEYVANTVKGRNWVVNKMIWDYENGAEVEPSLFALKNRIENKIRNSDPSELGNMIRKYLERLLKEICFNLEVKLKFLYNDQNENRMIGELLSELKGKLRKRNCEVKDHEVFSRLEASTFIGNKTSHDSSFSESISDLKVFYDDVLKLEKLFLCSEDNCGKNVSKKYYDPVEKVIRCKCGNLRYNWEE